MMSFNNIILMQAAKICFQPGVPCLMLYLNFLYAFVAQSMMHQVTAVKVVAMVPTQGTIKPESHDYNS